MDRRTDNHHVRQTDRQMIRQMIGQPNSQELTKDRRTNIMKDKQIERQNGLINKRTEGNGQMDRKTDRKNRER
jgi:hypothetical protein